MTTAVILAGGLGTRLRSAVPDLPKPMAPIAGRPFLEHLLDYWIAQGINRFVLSVGYRHEIIVDHFGAAYKRAALVYAIEEAPLGTGGAVLLAAAEVAAGESFLVLNGDTYFAAELKALVAFAQQYDADWCFSLFQPAEEGRYMGMEVSPQGQITALKSGSARSGHPANGGVYWMHPRVLQNCHYATGTKFSLEDDLAPAALTNGLRVFGCAFPGTFIDIGVPDDYRRAAAVIAA